MATIQALGLDPNWVLGIAFLAGVQYALFLALSARQRRGINVLLQTLDSRIRRFGEAERNELEVKLLRLSEEQRQGIESLKSSFLESELRRQTGPARPDGPSGGRLDKRHQVMSLAQMGLDSRDISRKLRLSRSETELLLGLGECFRTTEAPNGERAV
jgi:hypothetical protein